MTQAITKTIQYLIFTLVIVVPLVYYPYNMFPFQVVKTAIFQALTAIVFLLWLFLAIFYKEFRPKLTWVSLALIIFYVVVFLSIIFGADWRASLWSDQQRTLGFIILLHCGALFLALSSLKERINWRKIWLVSFITSVVVSVIGIVGYWYPSFIPDSMFLTVLKNQARAGSTFNNSAFMAGYLLFNFFIGIWLMWLEAIKTQGRKILKSKKFWGALIGVGLVFMAIFLSQTVGVILGMAGGIFLLFIWALLFSQNKIFKKYTAVLIGVIVIFSGIFFATKNSSIWENIPGLNKISGLSFESEAISGRLVAWGIGLQAFQEKPILGWGFENFRAAFSKHYEPKILTTSMSGTYWDKPHNIVIEYLVNTGLLGLLAYLFIFIVVFFTLIKKRDNFGNNLAAPIFLSVIVAYFIQNLFIFDTIGTYLMFFLILGFIDSKAPIFLRKKEENSFTEKSGKFSSNQYVVLGLILLVSFYAIHFNYRIFSSSRYEYWGVNYFLNQMLDNSLVSFNKALAQKSPYIDDARKNFANTVKQAKQQGFEYAGLENLQAELAEELRTVIKRHPNEFFNYITLAEFANVFYAYNSNYLEEAEGLTQRALELSPKRQQIFYVLAKTKLLQGDIKSAYEIFEEVVALNPEAGDSHFLFGMMAYGLGDIEKARQEIAIAESLGRVPAKADELIALGNFAGDLDGDYDKAIEYYKRALGASDKVGEANIILKIAVAYYLKGEAGNAREMFMLLAKRIDVKTLPIYPQLIPVFQELELNL